MNNHICNECGTENESNFEFCKNCGARLNRDEQQNAHSSYNEQWTDNSHGFAQSQGFTVENINGIPTEQIALFVGKKSGYYCPRFSRSVVSGTKTSWNFAPAVLGLVFGPLGSALWCFYRKMYKTALILVAIGLIVSASVAALTYDTAAQTFDFILSLGEYETTEEVLAALETFAPKETAKTSLASTIDNISCWAAAIIMGVFANYLYMNHCTSSIKKYRNSGLDQRYYKLGLASLGGTSGGMLALGILIMIAVENLSTTAVFIIQLLN